MGAVFEIIASVILPLVTMAIIFGISIGADAFRDALARRRAADFDRELSAQETAWLDALEVKLSAAAHHTGSSTRFWSWAWLPFIAVSAAVVAVSVTGLFPLHEWITASLYSQSGQAVIVSAGWGGWLVGIGIWTGIFGLSIASHVAIHRRKDWLSSLCLNVTMLGVDSEGAQIGLMSDGHRAVCARDIHVHQPPDLLPFFKAKNRFYMKFGVVVCLLGLIPLICIYLHNILNPTLLYTDKIVSMKLLSNTKTIQAFADMESVEIDCHSHEGAPMARMNFHHMNGTLTEIALPDGYANRVSEMLQTLEQNGVVLQVSIKNECRTTCLAGFTDKSGKRALASYGPHALPRGSASF